MELYIPEHLRRIPLIGQLCTLVTKYQDWYEESPTDSFNDYEYSLSTDPVRKFIKECIPEETWELEDQDYTTVINYLAKLFYSVKGTNIVFEYMKRYLNLTFVGDIIYTSEHVEFGLTSLNTSDETLFRDLLEGFLGALLFYSTLTLNIAKINIEIDSTITKYIQAGAVTYRVYSPEPLN